MADITAAVNESRKAGVRRMKKHSLKVDMTPMVDLGFLLISFFVITAELSKPRAMNLYMPHDGEPTPTKESTAISILAGADNRLFYYYGEEKDAGEKNPVVEVSWDRKTGLGKILTDKQMQLDVMKTGRDQMVVIIKPGKAATYKNVVDILDEMAIHQITRYALVKPGEKDSLFLSMAN